VVEVVDGDKFCCVSGDREEERGKRNGPGFHGAGFGAIIAWRSRTEGVTRATIL
jgi:hypothetical protein